MKKKTIQEKWVEKMFFHNNFFETQWKQFFFMCRAQWKINSQEDLSLLFFTPLEGTKMLFIFFSAALQPLVVEMCITLLHTKKMFSTGFHTEKKNVVLKKMSLSRHTFSRKHFFHTVSDMKNRFLCEKKKEFVNFFFFSLLWLKRVLEREHK